MIVHAKNPKEFVTLESISIFSMTAIKIDKDNFKTKH